MTYRERILSEVESYLASAKISERAFSIAACGHPKFVSRLRSGVSTLRSIEAAAGYMRDHPVSRPTPEAANV